MPLIRCKYCGDLYNPQNIEDPATDVNLCQDCNDDYLDGEDKTGYCSLSCIITGHCDDSC